MRNNGTVRAVVTKLARGTNSFSLVPTLPERFTPVPGADAFTKFGDISTALGGFLDLSVAERLELSTPISAGAALPYATIGAIAPPPLQPDRKFCSVRLRLRAGQ